MEILKPLDECRYYNGEEKCPFDGQSIEATFWGIEELWVKLVNADEKRRSRMVIEFVLDNADQYNFLDVPVSLKATLYDQYYHFMSGKDGFDNFIKTYVKLTVR